MKYLYLLHFKKVMKYLYRTRLVAEHPKRLLAAYETYTCDACRTRLVAELPKNLLAAYETYRGGPYIRHATHVGRA